MVKLITLKNKNPSYAYNTNLLYQKDNIFLMDNHRMAAWCWANKLENNSKYTIVHIDKHYDTLGNQMEDWTSQLPSGIKGLDYNEYDKLEYHKDKYEKYRVFRWDNYIPLFHYYHSESIIDYMFFTQKKGSIPENLQSLITHYSFFNLINDFPDYFKKYTDNLIINLDLDYFFSNNPRYLQLFSDSIIQKIIQTIMTMMKNKDNILTISISPECCGGWTKSLNFLDRYFKEYGIKI